MDKFNKKMEESLIKLETEKLMMELGIVDYLKILETERRHLWDRFRKMQFGLIAILIILFAIQIVGVFYDVETIHIRRVNNSDGCSETIQNEKQAEEKVME